MSARSRRSAEEVRAKVGLLAARYSLPAAAQTSLLDLLGVLEADSLAPTTIRAPLKAADDHLADSLVALELDQVRTARSILDLGSGAGFPGLPLAIALPEANVTLLESNQRKCLFIERLAAAGRVDNTTVVHARAEEWSAGVGRFDLVAVRAVAALPVVAEYAAPLLCLGGALVAWRGQREYDEERAASIAASELRLGVVPPIRVHPYPGVSARYLHPMVKVAPTPTRFPRRPGTARKRPLGR